MNSFNIHENWKSNTHHPKCVHHHGVSNLYVSLKQKGKLENLSENVFLKFSPIIRLVDRLQVGVIYFKNTNKFPVIRFGCRSLGCISLITILNLIGTFTLKSSFSLKLLSTWFVCPITQYYFCVFICLFSWSRLLFLIFEFQEHS